MAAAPVGLLRSLAGRAIAHPPRQSPPPAGLLRPLGLLRSLAASREAASLTGVSVSDFSGRGQRAKRAHRAYGRHRRARARAKTDNTEGSTHWAPSRARNRPTPRPRPAYGRVCRNVSTRSDEAADTNFDPSLSETARTIGRLSAAASEAALREAERESEARPIAGASDTLRVAAHYRTRCAFGDGSRDQCRESGRRVHVRWWRRRKRRRKRRRRWHRGNKPGARRGRYRRPAKQPYGRRWRRR